MRKSEKLKAIAILCAAVFSVPGQLSAGAEEVTASDSEGVNLTIYNQNFGVVKDIRNVTLSGGLNMVRFSDVAAQIDPTSVSFISLTAPDSVVIREQNYEYDLIDPGTILRKSIGKTAKFREYVTGGGVHEFSGILLSAPGIAVSDPSGYTRAASHGIVVKTATGIVLNPRGEVELAELPAGLISKPSLLWKMETNKPGAHKAEVAYQTQGMNWHADYVAILNKDDNQLDLTSWVTLDNKSGATYKNAALKLMAGDVHRVTEAAAPMAYAQEARMSMMKGGSQFQEQSFAEYHLYTLQGKTDVKDNETKQMSLFNADKIPAKKLFVFEPQSAQHYGYNPGGDSRQKVNVKIEVDNSQKNGLGIPMPKGKVRVYKRDADGALQFIGEDLIDHTAKDEKVRLYIGDAFDVVGEQRQTNQQNLERMSRQSYEVSIRNHKDTEITVTVVEHAYGDWTILNSSIPYTKKDSHTFEFTPKVAANGEVKFTYEVQMRW